MYRYRDELGREMIFASYVDDTTTRLIGSYARGSLII
jgi:hypothetical protein